jgi:Cof subfamily protein (haloacid dehalogenase superfamily)
MRYKLIAVDVDGTLLNSDGNISEVTKKAVKLGIEKGLIFTISTGRPIQGVEPLIKKLELDCDLPFITYNGAMVVLGKSREILYDQRLSSIDAYQIMSLGKKYDVTIAVWKDNKLYISEINERSAKYKEIAKVEPLLIKDENEIIKDGVTKILWYGETEQIQVLEKEVGKYLSSNINIHTSRPMFLEFVDKNASKAIAMEKIGEHFGINQSEMIAVGDGSNDLSMIEYAGLGVAMANAKQSVKDMADFITLSNDEDGVAHVINKFVLENI